MKTILPIRTAVIICLTAIVALGFRVTASPISQGVSDKDWPIYGGDLSNMRYADVDQVKQSNVTQLIPVWIFHTGVFSPQTSFESQPIIVDGTLYVSSPHDHFYALDATTGELKWTYNPEMP